MQDDLHKRVVLGEVFQDLWHEPGRDGVKTAEVERTGELAPDVPGRRLEGLGGGQHLAVAREEITACGSEGGALGPAAHQELDAQGMLERAQGNGERSRGDVKMPGRNDERPFFRDSDDVLELAKGDQAKPPCVGLSGEP